jgi:phage/plasmid-like protein (TIGR03299 family)
MAHYFDTGFAVRNPSWHGQETLLTEDRRPRTWSEARKHAGLDWEPIVEPMFVRKLESIDQAGNPIYSYHEVPGFQTVQRDDTSAVLHAGRDTLEVINNTQMGEILHALTDKTELEYETGGSVREGRSVWALVRLGADVFIGSDPSPTRPYMGIVNHFDKTGACRAYATDIRIVCWNTMSAADAQADRDNTVAVFRHTSNWRDHLETARQAILGANQEFNEWKAMAEHLQELAVTDAQAEDFVSEFMPYPGGTTTTMTERVKSNVDTARMELRTVLHESKTTEGIRGTGYWLVQGAAEYLDHLRPWKSQQSYVRRTVIDTNAGKAMAYAKVLELVKS